MKFNKFLAGFFLAVVAVLALGTVSAKAASKKITLTPSTKKDAYQYLVVYIETSLKDVVKMEYKAGKVKKAADKYWKDSEELEYFYTDEETGKTKQSFLVYDNGTYTVRVTTKSGKKYVKSIKIKNLCLLSENASCVYRILKVSNPNSKGNYTITVDCKRQLTAPYSLFRGTKVGDTVKLAEGAKLKIMEFRKYANGAYTTQDKYDDDVTIVVVRPLNPSDLYNTDEDYPYSIEESPNYYDFGFINDSDYEETLNAWIDYEWYDDGDYYVPLYYSMGTKKFVVTKKTNVKLAYVDWTVENAPKEISGTDYCAIRKGTKEIEGVYVYDTVDVSIFEKYDKKTNSFTNVVGEIKEIYTP